MSKWPYFFPSSDVVKFDNSYSWARSKEVFYSVKLLPPDEEPHSLATPVQNTDEEFFDCENEATGHVATDTSNVATEPVATDTSNVATGPVATDTSNGSTPIGHFK